MRVDVIQSYRAVFSFTYFETNECVTFCDILHILRHIVTRSIDIQLDCLYQLRGLSSLTIHNVCTNEMLSAVAETCSRLQAISFYVV